MSESTQKQIGRTRAPRVHITYDVETGGEIQTKELPFVVGVMSDLSGSRRNGVEAYKDRSFVNIDSDNFDEVLEGMQPTLDLEVDEKMSGEEDKKMKVALEFSSMDDFSPEKLMRQVPALKSLLEVRSKLNDLAAKLDGNDKLSDTLSEILQNTDKKDALVKEVQDSAKDSEE